jgi:uroporphyrinogen-III synthase
MRRVVVLRPEPGASETVQRARDLGLNAVAMPLFEIEPVAWEAPDPAAFDGLLLTSANAVRFGGAGMERLTVLPTHAIGEATAAAAREAGFTVAAVGTGDVDDLLSGLPAHVKLLHLSGEHRRLPAGQHAVAPVVVYRSKVLPLPDDPAVLRGAVALVHSPRAGRRLREIVDLAALNPAEVVVAAISAAAAKAAGSGWRAIEAAEGPTDSALLALAALLCNKPRPA